MKERRIPVAEARSHLAALLKDVERGARVKITRYNRTVAGIISQQDLTDLRDCQERKTPRRGRVAKV